MIIGLYDYIYHAILKRHKSRNSDIAVTIIYQFHQLSSVFRPKTLNLFFVVHSGKFCDFVRFLSKSNSLVSYTQAIN